MRKKDAVREVLLDRRLDRPRASGVGFAPINIALCKYWGKRDEELNLPLTSSLSISLGRLGSGVQLRLWRKWDQIFLNGRLMKPDTPFARRALAFLDLFRPARDVFFDVQTINSIATAAGLASSASGFAALTLALDNLFDWRLEPRALSILARLGSGSACRSIYDGFVEWHAGQDRHGMDSFAEPLDATWPDLRVGLVVLSDKPKAVGSRAAMRQTVTTSPLYSAWPQQVAKDLAAVKQAIRERDFLQLGKTAEGNALAMHATMMAARPPVLYWLPASLEAIHKILALRADGLSVYFTMDAGPNVKLLFLKQDAPAVRSAFPGLKVIAPFDKK